jgi:D-alanyl-lipoteichoic acid acyltransferase DltB (MBOAT superfamily)
MLFISLEFLLGFLPVAVGGTALLVALGERRFVVAYLLAASFVFYAWRIPEHFVLLAFSIGFNYAAGRYLYRNRSRIALATAVAVNLALLAAFKYAGFVADNLNGLAGVEVSFGAIVLPLAISFYTFQQIAYLVDSRRGDAAPHRFLDYALFVAFFPQLIAGPIVHHKELTPQFSGPRFATFRADDIRAGIVLFSIGLAKKVLIADNLRPVADASFGAAALGVEPSMAEAWIGTLAYAFQIYFDFSAYSDMALGLGRAFGVTLPVNFDSPYKAASIVEFWRRWHITLSRFLRDYLYVPLGGNRRGPQRRYANLMIVMLLGGLWHGANWTFVVWGGLHGLYLVVNHLWSRMAGGRIALPRPVGGLITFVAVLVAWVFFRAGSFGEAFTMLHAMSGAGAAAHGGLALFRDVGFALVFVPIAAGIAWCCPNALEILRRIEEAPEARRAGAFATAGLGAATALALVSLYASGPYEFIYFQF